MSIDKANVPREVELHLVNCVCDHCGEKLDKLRSIWVWNEHFACSRSHAQLAQGETNKQKRLDEIEDERDEEEKLEEFFEMDEDVQREIDLL